MIRAASESQSIAQREASTKRARKQTKRATRTVLTEFEKRPNNRESESKTSGERHFGAPAKIASVSCKAYKCVIFLRHLEHSINISRFTILPVYFHDTLILGLSLQINGTVVFVLVRLIYRVTPWRESSSLNCSY